MKKVAFLLTCAVFAGCAPTKVQQPSARTVERIRQGQAMRAAARTAAQSAAHSGCLMQSKEVPRSLMTTTECLSCHDGASAPSVGTHSHPTSVVYASASVRTALRPVVADGIVLLDGAVECASCHDPASRYPASTALTLDRSTLCLGCHVH